MTDPNRYIRFGGLSVHYCVYEPESPDIRHCVLLLCSPLMTVFHWRKLLPELETEDCLVVAAELPGFGRGDCGSDIPMDAETRARIFWGVLDEVELEFDLPVSTWHLVAHGTACPTILRMAALYPDAVRSQIHITPQFFLQAARESENTLAKRFTDIVTDAERFRAWVEKSAGTSLDEYITDKMREPLLRRGARASFVDMLKQCAVVPTDDMGFCPVMCLLGGKDPFAAESDALTRKLLGGAERHLLREAGHWPMETDSRALRDYLRGWLRYNEG